MIPGLLPGDALAIRTGSRIFGKVIAVAQWWATRHGRQHFGDAWKYDHIAWFEGDDWAWESSTSGVHRFELAAKYDVSRIKVIHLGLSLADYSAAKAEAERWSGTPYGWIDDAAMGLGVLGYWPRWVERRCLDTHTMNCSEYVARIALTANSRRWGPDWWRVLPYQIAATPN